MSSSHYLNLLKPFIKLVVIEMGKEDVIHFREIEGQMKNSFTRHGSHVILHSTHLCID